jgi:hypothetical protein
MEGLDCAIANAEVAYSPYVKVFPFSICALAGVLGAQNVLFGKIVAELILESFVGDTQFVYVMTYVYMGCLLASIGSQLHFLARALEHCDAMYVVPVFQCFWVTTSTIGGAMFFQEFSGFSGQQKVLFPLGIVITLCGVLILSRRKMGKHVSTGGVGSVHIDLEDDDARSGARLIDPARVDFSSGAFEQEEAKAAQPTYTHTGKRNSLSSYLQHREYRLRTASQASALSMGSPLKVGSLLDPWLTAFNDLGSVRDAGTPRTQPQPQPQPQPQTQTQTQQLRQGLLSEDRM